MFENDDECVIGGKEKQAWQIWLKSQIGDTIVFENKDGMYKELTIVGIVREDYHDFAIPDAIKFETIYTTLESAEYFEPFIEFEKGSSVDHIFKLGYDAVIYLKSPEYYYSFQDEVLAASRVYQPGYRSLLDTVYPAVDNPDTILWDTSGRINEAALMFFIRLIVIVTTGISTITFLSNRKYEIAVLRSAGMKKSKIMASYLIENLALIWGVTLISYVSAQVITVIFAGSLNIPKFESFTTGMRYLLQENIVEIFGGATVFAAVSTVIACVNIMRFAPLKIFNRQY
jgi:ABC-type antimicrobial peptide transport system permease subunit